MGSNTNKQLAIQAFRHKIGNLIRNQIAQNEACSCDPDFGLHHHDYGFREASRDQRRSRQNGWFSRPGSEEWRGSQGCARTRGAEKNTLQVASGRRTYNDRRAMGRIARTGTGMTGMTGMLNTAWRRENVEYIAIMPRRPDKEDRHPRTSERS